MAAPAPATAPPIEVPFPNLAAHAPGNRGVPYAWTFAAARAGPHVLLQALTHGNEICGAIALDWVLREGVRPARGTLSIVFANVAAYERFDPGDPFASRCVDEDFNRLWSADVLDGSRDSTELRRARELRPLYDRVDHLLDLHSMSDPCPPLAMAGRRAKGRLGAALAPQYVDRFGAM
jgi:predicted deacylase